MPLPDSNWYWEGPWQAETEGADAEGWQYSRTWTAGWRPDAAATCFVRRRTWRRTRKLKTREIRRIEEASKGDVALELEELVDEFESLDVPFIDDESVESAVHSALEEADRTCAGGSTVGVATEQLLDLEEPCLLDFGAPPTEEECLADELAQASVLSEAAGATEELAKEAEAPEQLEFSLVAPVALPSEGLCALGSAPVGVGSAPVGGAQEPTLEELQGIAAQNQLPDAEAEETKALAEDKYHLELLRIQQEAEARAVDRARREAEDARRKQEADEEFARRETERMKKLEESKRAREREQELAQEAWRAKEEEMRRQLEADQRRLQSLLGVGTASEEVADAAAESPVEAATPPASIPTPAASLVASPIANDNDDDDLDSMFEACSDDEFSDDDET